MTGRKEVSFADAQSGIIKPSFPPMNEGYQLKIPKLVNLTKSVLRCSERIRKSHNAKEAEEYHHREINAFTAKILLAFYTVLSIVFS